MAVNDRKNHYTLQQGFLIMEVIVVICVLVSLMSLGSRYITQNAEYTVNKITAQQLRQITKAARNYVQDHYQQFKSDPSQILNWKNLVDSGYLSSHSLEKNSYGQSYCFTVQEEHGLLQLVMTTEGGNPISESSLRHIAALAGSAAGYASVLHQDKIVGHQEGWFLEGVPLKRGHLASLTLVNEREVMDAATFLRRTKVADHTEYNRMETDLEIEKHLLKIVNGSSQTQLSSETITLDNPLGSDKTKHISLDVGGSPMLQIKDTYNQNGSIESLLSGDRLEFTRSVDDNEIKLDNGDPSIIMKNSKTWSTQINPAEIRLKSQASGSISYIGNDYLEYKRNGNKSTRLDVNGLVFDGNMVASNDFIKVGFYDVGDVEDQWQLQDVADKLDCTNNEGRLFAVGDKSVSLRKKLLMCIWRDDLDTHSYLIVTEGDPWTNRYR